MEEIAIFWMLVVGLSIPTMIILYLFMRVIPCENGGIHDWELISTELGSFKDSGFTFHYDYNSVYRCKRCGKIDKE